MPRCSPGSSAAPMPRTPAAVAVSAAPPPGRTNPAPFRRPRSTVSTAGPGSFTIWSAGSARRRGIVLHAMGGMGKTALAAEAAHWWTRSGLFRDGACFLSFEQFASAERVVQVLGAYLEGPNFDQLPASEQRRRAIELFREKAVLMVWDNFESTLPQFNEDSRRPRQPLHRRRAPPPLRIVPRSHHRQGPGAPARHLPSGRQGASRRTAL